MDNFSNLMMINECLLDKERVDIFSKAIFSSVKEGDVVLDAGAGSGILSFLAIKAGAKLVFSVEIDPIITKIIKKNAEKLGYKDKIKAINMDIKSFSVGKPNIVIMEMLDTWLAAEQQMPAMNSLIKNGCVCENTTVIPRKVQNYLQFVNYDFNFYGFNLMQPVQARNFGVLERIKKAFTDPLFVEEIDLKKQNRLSRSKSIVFSAMNEGTANAVVLRTKLYLTELITTWGTTDMNMPVIIPIEPFQVSKDEKFEAHISYSSSYGFDKVLIKVNRAKYKKTNFN